MRLMIFVFGVLFLIGFVSAVSEDCDVDTVAYWQMEDSVVGGPVADRFGLYDGVGFPGIGGSFAVGSSADFDDGLKKISIGDSGAGTIGGSFAIEFWVQKDIFAPDVDSFLLNGGGYQVRWTAADVIEATVNSVVVSSGALTPGLSYHVVLTWHATNQVLTLYVSGAVVDSEALINKGSFSNLLEIGENFVGLIDEVAIYGRAFGAADVSSHHDITFVDGLDYCSVAPGEDTVLDNIEDGCALPGGGVIAESSCTRDGMYYCGVGKALYYTLGGHDILPGEGGCSMEDPAFVPQTGMTQCCPSGYFCSDDLDDAPDLGIVCNQRTEECSIQGDQGDCDRAGCFWIDGDCVDNPLDYSCSIYDSEISCDLDVWNVGAAGVGTEVCGSSFIEGGDTYVIPLSSCACEWTAAEECVLGYDVDPNVVANQDEFRCQKDFDSGVCVDGLQQVSWTASGSVIGGWISGIDNDVLVASGCETGGIDRVCGEPIIKVSGFTLLNLIASVGILTLIYAFKQ